MKILLNTVKRLISVARSTHDEEPTAVTRKHWPARDGDVHGPCVGRNSCPYAHYTANLGCGWNHRVRLPAGFCNNGCLRALFANSFRVLRSDNSLTHWLRAWATRAPHPPSDLVDCCRRWQRAVGSITAATAATGLCPQRCHASQLLWDECCTALRVGVAISTRLRDQLSNEQSPLVRLHQAGLTPRSRGDPRGGAPQLERQTGSNTSRMHISSGSGCAASLTRTGSPQCSRGERSWAKGGSIDGIAAITDALNPSP